jgi:hypothetical protein
MMATTSEPQENNGPKDKLMSELRKYLMLMAILAASVTYVAGLNPPGGVWVETADGRSAWPRAGVSSNERTRTRKKKNTRTYHQLMHARTTSE